MRYRFIISGLLGLIMLSSFALQGQNKGAITINVFPATASISLNGEKFKHSGYTLEVEPGEHRIWATAPRFVPLDTVVTVYAGDTLSFKAVLHYSDAWVDFQVQKAKFDKRKGKAVWWGIASLALVPASVIGTVYMQGRVDDQAERIRGIEENYLDLIDEANITDIRQTHADAVEVHDQMVKEQRIVTIAGFSAVGVTGLAAVITYFRWKKGKPPEFEENSTPLSMSRIMILPPPPGAAGAGLSIRF